MKLYMEDVQEVAGIFAANNPKMMTSLAAES